VDDCKQKPLRMHLSPPAVCSLQLWRAEEHHRDAEEAVVFDNDAAFRHGLESFCALKEIFTVISTFS